MTIVAALVGLALGALAGAAHLAVTHHRAQLVVEGRGRAALAWLPVGFGAIAAAVLLAARFDRKAAWLVPVGLLVVRFVFFRGRGGRP